MKMVNILIIGHGSEKTAAQTRHLQNDPNREIIVAVDTEAAIEWLYRMPFDLVIVPEAINAIQNKKLEKLISWQFPETTVLYPDLHAPLDQQVTAALEQQQKELKALYSINDDAFKGFIAWE